MGLVYPVQVWGAELKFIVMGGGGQPPCKMGSLPVLHTEAGWPIIRTTGGLRVGKTLGH